VDDVTGASSTGLSPRVAAPLAYLGWWVTGAIVWFVERQDARVRFHAAQAVTAFGLVAALVALFAGLAIASLSFMPGAFSLFGWAAAATWALGMLLWIAAIWKAANGDAFRIPLAAGLADRLVSSNRASRPV
jgi:uncharacterized membrane protein